MTNAWGKSVTKLGTHYTYYTDNIDELATIFKENYGFDLSILLRKIKFEWGYIDIVIDSDTGVQHIIPLGDALSGRDNAINVYIQEVLNKHNLSEVEKFVNNQNANDYFEIVKNIQKTLDDNGIFAFVEFNIKTKEVMVKPYLKTIKLNLNIKGAK